MDGTYAIMDALFGPVTGLHPALSLAVVSLAVTFVITLVYRFLSDPKKMKELRDRTKEINAKVKEIQNKNPEEAKRLTNEMLNITNKQMMANMKPMLVTLLVAAVTLPWMAEQYAGPIVKLPAEVPFFGTDLGWIVWYILISIPASQILRKLIGVDL
ncbi:MAG: EMC3/TMCO1 family protein [Candidatus Aenigmatarchaeota archaeon]